MAFGLPSRAFWMAWARRRLHDKPEICIPVLPARRRRIFKYRRIGITRRRQARKSILPAPLPSVQTLPELCASGAVRQMARSSRFISSVPEAFSKRKTSIRKTSGDSGARLKKSLENPTLRSRSSMRMVFSPASHLFWSGQIPASMSPRPRQNDSTGWQWKMPLPQSLRSPLTSRRRGRSGRRVPAGPRASAIRPGVRWTGGACSLP